MDALLFTQGVYNFKANQFHNPRLARKTIAFSFEIYFQSILMTVLANPLSFGLLVKRFIGAQTILPR